MKVTVESLLYLVLLILASWLRLGNLDLLPLTENEAVHALSAASVTKQASPFWGPADEIAPTNPTYDLVTGIIFQLFGSSDAAARMVPAIAGIALVFTPLLIRKRLGVSETLLTVALLAFSPSLITISRTAGSSSLATLGLLSGILLLVGAKNNQQKMDRMPWVGAAIGFAFAAGPWFYHGILVIVLSFTVPIWRHFRTKAKPPSWVKTETIQRLLISALIVGLGLAGGFGLALRGIAGLAESLTSWISSWQNPSGVTLLTTLLMIPIYELLIFIFGSIGLLQMLRKGESYRVGEAFFILGGLVALALYPGREGNALVWVVIPLASLAACTIVEVVNRMARRERWNEFIALSTMLLVLLAYFTLQLTAYASGVGPTFDAEARGLRLYMSFGVILLGGLVVILFGFGWSWDVAIESLGFAGLVFLATMTISSIWRLNFAPSAIGAQEIWRPQANTLGTRLMVSTLQTLSQAHTGREDSIEITVLGESTPSIAWAVRDFPSVEPGRDFTSDPAPVVLIKERDELPALTAGYTGQNLKTGERWGWFGTLPPDPISWWVKRQAPVREEHWILLVRLDVASLGERDWTETGIEP
jgi:hypothetical protein